MIRFRPLLITLLSCAVLTLAGCESEEDKAERFYQAGLALAEEGDKERAVLELRNVFNHDGFHKDARLLYASLALDLGRRQEAYGQYLRLVEQYPDTVEARVVLAEMAMVANDWEEVERHGGAAIELAPDLPEVEAIDIALRYRKAAMAKDTSSRAETGAEAARLLNKIRESGNPDNDGLVRVVIDNLVQSGAHAEALKAVDAALERAPKAEDLNLLKVRLLSETQDTEGTGAHLLNMVDLFPENDNVKRALIQWYMSQKDYAAAESFLRAEAGADTADPQGHLSVIQLLRTTQGDQASRAELERLQAANEGTENGRFYAVMLASGDFQSGEREQAIADIRAAIAASEDGAQKIKMQLVLARMLLTVGETEEGNALVDTILESDASNVAALRMRAARLISEDKSGEAIVALRTALDQNPRDAETLTLMAQAHERDGDVDLVGERLALALEVSGNAAPEAMRYAQFLVREHREQVAITVLQDARRRAPDDPKLLLALANLHLRVNEWPLARALAQELRSRNTPEALRAATELEARILLAQDRTEDSLALLQEQLDDSSDANSNEQIRAIVMIVQTQIRSRKLAAARQTLETALKDTPDNANLRFLNATLFAIEGNFDQAEAGYRALIAEFPQSELPVRMLVNLLSSAGRPADALAALETALETLPDRPNLLWMQASFLEQNGNYDGAIDIYERLYELNNNSPIIANNLASMITTYRDDSESLARAANIVRRLRGTDVPAFQDTYGWISYRRDNFEEALEYLEPAAAALANDPMVQYHLAMTYVALNRTEDARAQLEKTLKIAGDSPLPQFEKARETLAQLE